MGEEFEAGVSEGNWWNPSRAGFSSSPCNSSININESYIWAGDLVDMKGGGGGGGARSSEDSSDGNTAGDTMDSTLQMMGIGLSSSSSSITDWNQSLFRGNAILQEDLNYHQETAPEDDDQSTIQVNQVNFTTNYGYPSTMLQTLFDDNSPPEQSGYDAGAMNYSSTAATTNNYMTSLSDFSPNLPKLSHMVKPKQQVSTPFWKASSSALNDIRATFFTSSQSQFLPEEKPNYANFIAAKSKHDDIRNSVTMKKGCSEAAFKRPRLETPSPLPTFKVRKEKLGDRITALQQLVSPFGKTDTASVLHEAIDYIKLLHDQLNVLSSPYMKNGASMQCQQNPEKVKETEGGGGGGGAKQDLKSKGLCLVPVSSTFPIAAETSADFWTPTFGATFR